MGNDFPNDLFTKIFVKIFVVCKGLKSMDLLLTLFTNPFTCNEDSCW